MPIWQYAHIEKTIKDITIDWLKANPKHSNICHVLVPLAANYYSDSKIKKIIETWLDANSQNYDAYRVLVPLTTNCLSPSLEKIITEWLDSHPQHPQQSELLRQVIIKSRGDSKWLNRGRNYLAQPGTQHHQNIIGALLITGRATYEYVELAIRYLEKEANKKHKDYVNKILSRALASYPENAIKFLNEKASSEKKEIIGKSISFGLRVSIGKISGFVEKWDMLNSENQDLILSYLLWYKVQLKEIAPLLENWFYRHNQYPQCKRIIRMLQKNSNLQVWLKDSGILPIEILSFIDEQLNTPHEEV